MKAFYDTNVLLDVLLQREPFYEDSARVWTLAELSRLEGYVSALSFPNIFYVLHKMRNRRDAARAVRTMLGIFSAVACNGDVIRQAIDSDLPDFEDAVQYFSALHAGADCILSRNAGDFPRRSAVPVLSPAELLARIESKPDRPSAE